MNIGKGLSLAEGPCKMALFLLLKEACSRPNGIECHDLSMGGGRCWVCCRVGSI